MLAARTNEWEQNGEKKPSYFLSKCQTLVFSAKLGVPEAPSR